MLIYIYMSDPIGLPIIKPRIKRNCIKNGDKLAGCQRYAKGREVIDQAIERSISSFLLHKAEQESWKEDGSGEIPEELSTSVNKQNKLALLKHLGISSEHKLDDLDPELRELAIILRNPNTVISIGNLQRFLELEQDAKLNYSLVAKHFTTTEFPTEDEVKYFMNQKVDPKISAELDEITRDTIKTIEKDQKLIADGKKILDDLEAA